MKDFHFLRYVCGVYYHRSYRGGGDGYTTTTVCVCVCEISWPRSPRELPTWPILTIGFDEGLFPIFFSFFFYHAYIHFIYIPMCGWLIAVVVALVKFTHGFPVISYTILLDITNDVHNWWEENFFIYLFFFNFYRHFHYTRIIKNGLCVLILYAPSTLGHWKKAKHLINSWRWWWWFFFLFIAHFLIAWINEAWDYIVP